MRDNKTIAKVVGTTFRPLPEGDFVKKHGEEFRFSNNPAILARAVLMPEPDNPHDPDAVKVMVEMRSGIPFQIGYIGKNDPLKGQIKRAQPAMLRVVDYSLAGGQTSYQIIKVIK